MAREVIVEFKNVSKIYDSIRVLKNVSFALHRGESLVIAGASGSGKTTILKVLLGITDFDTGSVFLFGKDIKEIKEEELNKLRRRIGMVFQSGGLFDSLNVAENVSLPLVEQVLRERKLKEEDEGEIMKKVKNVLKLVDLEGTEDMMPSELSGGMMRRVAIARALITEPELMIYDEPTVGLDPITASKITKHILQLKEKLNVSSIFVTHDLRFAMKVGDRIMVLQEGRKIFDGLIDEFKESDIDYVIKFREAGL